MERDLPSIINAEPGAGSADEGDRDSQRSLDEGYDEGKAIRIAIAKA